MSSEDFRLLAERRNLGDDLGEVLRALYGDYNYQAAFRAEFEISQDRTIRNWLKNRSTIPPNVIEQLDESVTAALNALIEAQKIVSRMRQRTAETERS